MTTPDAADRLPRIAEAVLTGYLERDPVEATYLGDHTRDGLLADPTADASRRRAAEVRARLAELDALAPTTPDDDVDAEVLRTTLAAELLELDEIAEDDWNPMRHNPGPGLHALLSRDFAPLPDRLGDVGRRLTAVPAYLAAARRRLDEMSAIHLDTATDQLDGTLGLIDEAVALAGDSHREVVAAADAARTAVAEHQDWLRAHKPAARRDPRLGADVFRAKLRVTLDTVFDPESLLRAAEHDLDRIGADLEELAGRVAGVGRPDAGTVRDVLDRLAADAPTDATILDECRAALSDATGFVRDHALVTVFDDPVEIVAMPEVDRGVAVAYCRPNGPLESRSLPTEFAVSPTPAGWDADRVRSFYREYNAHMLRNLTAHEAMPGHALQLMHANRHRARARTPVRSVWWSGSFVEGWAVYAEEVMARYGFAADTSTAAADALRMQQLKMQLRTTINAILDIRFHCDSLDEAEALDLMQRRGFQEAGEAIGKWRRVQLSSTQLCTYYVGYREVSAVAADLQAVNPAWTVREVHDAMLAHGSPPARHLRTLLGLADSPGAAADG